MIRATLYCEIGQRNLSGISVNDCRHAEVARCCSRLVDVELEVSVAGLAGKMELIGVGAYPR